MTPNAILANGQLFLNEFGKTPYPVLRVTATRCIVNPARCAAGAQHI
jgi:hypothetical protein